MANVTDLMVATVPKTGLLTDKVIKDLILLRQQMYVEKRRHIKNLCGSHMKHKLIDINLLLSIINNYCYAKGQTILVTRNVEK